MATELTTEVIGKALTGIIGLTMGVLLLRRWRATGSRVVLHWAIFFLPQRGGTEYLSVQGDNAL